MKHLKNDGMVVDENVIIEIVTPGTGDAVEGEVGEVIVTVLIILNYQYLDLLQVIYHPFYQD